jgi:hypothetical protein
VQPARDTVTLRARAETNEALDLLWQMRDSIDATVRLDPVRPWRFALHQSENDRHYDTTIVTDGGRMIATVERRRHKARHADVAATPALHDPASMAYLIRMLPPDMAKPTSYQVLAGTKVYGITIAPTGTERIVAADHHWQARRYHLSLQLVPTDVEAGATPVAAAMRDGPERDDRQADTAKEPKVQEADLWVSAGPERLPLVMRAQTFWGWVAVELEDRSAVP